MAELSNVSTVAIEPSTDSLDQRRLKPQSGRTTERTVLRVKKRRESAEAISEPDESSENHHALDVKA